jgi:predicted ATP-dependent serine protease
MLGLEPECAVIDRILENARNGVSSALVVRGEAGIGKSTLFEYAMRQAAPGCGSCVPVAWKPSMTWPSPGCTGCCG